MAQSWQPPAHSICLLSAHCERSFVRLSVQCFSLACLVPMQRRAWLGCGAYVQRLALRADSPTARARGPGLRQAQTVHRTVCVRAQCIGLAAPSRNSLRSLRSLRSNTRDELVDNSRCARGRWTCASRRHNACKRCGPRQAKNSPQDCSSSGLSLSCAPQPSQACLCGSIVCTLPSHANMLAGCGSRVAPAAK